MRSFRKFSPNKKETFVCSECGHCFDRHNFRRAPSCMVPKCQCKGIGTFVRPQPIRLEEYVHGKRINQPLPPLTREY